MKNKIRSYFKNHPGINLKAKDLAKKLDAEAPHEFAELKQFLFDLAQEGYLEKTGKKYKLNRVTKGKITGVLQIVKDGSFGFVAAGEPETTDIFISEKNMGTAFDGDTVEVSLFAKSSGKNLEGQIINIIERKRKEIVGVLKLSKSFFFVDPDEQKIHREIYIHQNNLKGAKPGDKVVVSNISWKSNQPNPEGDIKEILGKAGTYDAELASIAREFGFSYKFPKKVLKEAESIPVVIPENEYKNRLNLTDKLIVTIDPDDAKDFDDAVSVDILENGNYRVGIHIADVSYFVHPGTALYTEALNRGTSVYTVGKVIPMLPEHLSNKVCSLVPNEDRLTFTVLAELTPRGKLIDYEIKKSVINSKRRFTYNEVQEILDNGKGDHFELLSLLNKISKTLRAKRMKKGSINFFTPEVHFTLDDNGVPVAVTIKEIKESHNLIEELMLLANQIVAGHVNKSGSEPSPFVYRIHDLPDQDKLTEFSRFVKTLGYSFDPNQANKSKQLQDLLESVKGTEEEALVNEVAIRSMAKAIYSTKNIGHYGLGFKYYTHFTSPIRRFPDLIVHKLIFDYTTKTKKEKNFSLEELEEICNHSSLQERSAVNAERLSVKLKQLEFLQNKIGEEFSAVVSGITHFGIFVELCQTLAEGLIRLRDMDDDFYIFDEKHYAITGKRTGKRIRLGDKIQVKLIRVDPERREIDFALLEE